MNKKKFLLSLSILFICLNTINLATAATFISLQNVTNMNFSSTYPKESTSNTTNLVIYEYSGFMGSGDTSSPIYNATAINNNIFIKWGQKNGYNIQIVTTDDANGLLTKLYNERSNPQADVVIGIDNALLALAIGRGIANDILVPYRPTNYSQLRPDLVQGLDPNYLLTPIDYGALAFDYNTNNVTSSGDLALLNNFTLDNLKSHGQSLVLESPDTSSPGTGFLLWTIAGYKSLNNSNGWTNFWSSIRDSVHISPSWVDAFNVWSTNALNRSFVLSYATDPAYSECLYNDSSISITFTHENGKNNTWLQIEGIGLVKGAPNSVGAKKFIDWMTSPYVQSFIPVTNWMYPANTNAALPACFQKYAINPFDKSLNILNHEINTSDLQTNLTNWVKTYDNIIAAGNLTPGFDLFPVLFSLFITTTVIIRFKRHQR